MSSAICKNSKPVATCLTIFLSLCLDNYLLQLHQLSYVITLNSVWSLKCINIAVVIAICFQIYAKYTKLSVVA